MTDALTRRHFLGSGRPRPRCHGHGRGSTRRRHTGGVAGSAAFAPRAKRVIYLFQAGGPSHWKRSITSRSCARARPGAAEEVIGNQRLTTMSGNQSLLPMAGSVAKFAKHGQCGMEISDLLPYTQKIADEICAASARCTPRRSITIRRSRFSAPATSCPAARRWARGRRRARQREREPAGFVVLSVEKRSATSRSTRGCGARVFAQRASGGAVSRREGSGSLSDKPRGRLSARPPRDARRARETERLSGGAATDPEIERASPSPRWPTGCRRPCRR